jgi:hypothetical protein
MDRVLLSLRPALALFSRDPKKTTADELKVQDGERSKDRRKVQDSTAHPAN